MKFKIDPEFETYWPPLPDEKLVILEQSILAEGLRENLAVWKEKNVLLDGHQRLRICKKHGIDVDDRITYLSFPDAVHAKHWVHVAQAGRRGDAPQFLSICHVLEFEPIYREEAAKRKKSGTLCINDTGGPSRSFMARDAGSGEQSVIRVLYIKQHDPARFESLRKLAQRGEDYDKDGGPGRGKGGKEISIHLEWSKVQAVQDAKRDGVAIDSEALEQFDSSNTVRAFSETVRKYKPPVHTQKQAAEAIVKNNTTADKNYVEDAVIHRLPKREPKRQAEKTGMVQLRDKMKEIAEHFGRAIKGIEELKELRLEYGDDVYFQAVAETPEIRAAFAEFNVAAKAFQRGGNREN